MINMVGVEYILPPPPAPPDIPAVAASVPFKGLKRGKDRDEGKKKRRSAYDEILAEKEAEGAPGQMGCFCEARA